MVKDHSDNERENLLLPHGLLFPISSKGSFICIKITETHMQNKRRTTNKQQQTNKQKKMPTIKLQQQNNWSKNVFTNSKMLFSGDLFNAFVIKHSKVNCNA